ncbi:MAG: hypothetical protein EA424_02595, partial [Planctomycetaceae bacterium]
MTRPNHAHWLLALVTALICGGCGKTETERATNGTEDYPRVGHGTDRPAEGYLDLNERGLDLGDSGPRAVPVRGGESGTPPSWDIPLYPQARKVEQPVSVKAFFKMFW